MQALVFVYGAGYGANVPGASDTLDNEMLKRVSAAMLVFALVACAQWVALAQNDSKLAVRQLIWPLESQNAFLNGEPVQLAAASRVLQGRAVLPLRETNRILALGMERTNNQAEGLRLGRLEVYPSLKLARLDGKQMPLSEVGAVIDGVLYLAARSLEQAVSASVSFDASQRLLRLTVSNRASTGPRLPVARFATDKPEYRIGETVRIVEYSYDPDGLAITALKFVGREEAYFAPGNKTISLVVTNSAGRQSESFSTQIRISNEVFLNARDYALRRVAVGRNFVDNDVLSYPMLVPVREDEETPLLVSDSPEDPNRAGLLMQENATGPARLMAYHTNGGQSNGRVLVMANNLEPNANTIAVNRLGETAATQVVATLGQVSLLDFLTSSNKQNLALGAGQSAALYLSASLAPGEGINLMVDLVSEGAVEYSTYFLDEALFAELGEKLNSIQGREALRTLATLEMDANHVRGKFPGAVRKWRFDLGALPVGSAGRMVIGDNKIDPALQGKDSITGRAQTLLGNFGITYRIALEGAAGTVAAFVPRGGPYSGAIRVAGMYHALPQSGILYRQDTLALVYRYLGFNLEGGLDAPLGALNLEFVPASGSYLPVNLVFYRVEASAEAGLGARVPTSSLVKKP